MIDSKDVSVVVQGAISPQFTSNCLKSIRTFLPQAEIILSSWQGSEIKDLDFDKIILSRDVGGNICSRDKKGVNNCNREIVSTFAGIKLASRKYILKLRTDIILKNNNILRLCFEELKRDAFYSFTKNRIVVCSIYSRLFAKKDNKIFPILFHPSDWIYFGLKEDIYDVFDIPLTNEPKFSMWFDDKPQERGRFIDAHKYRLWKFAPESYIWSSYLHKKIEFVCQDKLDITAKLIKLSRRSIVNNFYIADQIQLGINLEKYNIKQHLMPIIDREGLYSNYIWQKDYKRFCDHDYHVKPTITMLLSKLVDIFNIERNRR